MKKFSLEDLQKHLIESSSNVDAEFKRLFHGRGGLYDGLKHIVIDSIDEILSVTIYFQEENEDALLKMLKDFVQDTRYKVLLVQKRYIKGSPTEVLVGKLPEDIFAIENGMKFKLNLLSNKNNGYFADMKNGRQFVRENAKDKRVLNLFSYTCAFSVAAKFGGAYEVINVDMSKSALKVGMINHSINNLDPRGVSYLSYNILKSFSSLKRKGPYDLIIIDPPTFQKGSFEATKDYRKLIMKLPQLASEECILLACLNSPDLDEDFLKNLIQELASSFKFSHRISNLDEFKSIDESRSLKNLVFKRSVSKPSN
jgi:23S rRNA (cytosine1962-C5)-methyltransferase